MADAAARSVYRAIWNTEYDVDLAANGRCGSHRLAEQIAGALAKDGLLAAPAPAAAVDREALLDVLTTADEDWKQMTGQAGVHVNYLEHLADRLIAADAITGQGPTPRTDERWIGTQHLVEAEIAIARLTKDSAGRPVQHSTSDVARAVADAFELELHDEPPIETTP